MWLLICWPCIPLRLVPKLNIKQHSRKITLSWLYKPHNMISFNSYQFYHLSLTFQFFTVSNIIKNKTYIWLKQFLQTFLFFFSMVNTKSITDAWKLMHGNCCMNHAYIRAWWNPIQDWWLCNPVLRSTVLWVTVWYYQTPTWSCWASSQVMPSRTRDCGPAVTLSS